MLATWPEAAAWADETAKVRLMASYVRRKQYEAKLLLAAVADVLGQSGESDRVSATEMMSYFGVTF